MKLMQTYNDRGEKRPYCIGEDGNEYFVYHFKNGYTIREMNSEDVREWYKVMKEENGIKKEPLQKAIEMALISKKVEESLGGSLEKSFLVFSPDGNLLGEMDFFEEKGTAIAMVELYMRNSKTCITKGMKCFELLARMNNDIKLYDELWTIDIRNQRIKIA